MARQTTNKILMVSPETFSYNNETSGSNSFQNKANYDLDTLRERVMDEFNGMVETLNSNGVEVFMLGGNESEDDLPDAVFPNNWFATYEDGTLIYFPMLTENRRKERDMDLAEGVLEPIGFTAKSIIDLTNYEKEHLYLEGTGSLVLDRKSNAVFAIESERTSKEVFDVYCSKMNISPGNRIFFSAHDEDGKPIYHTNVMMSIGDGFAVICDECISRSDRIEVISKLESLGLEVIRINYHQLKSFCGNILSVRSVNGEPVIVMSVTARWNFEESQIKQLEKYGKIIEVNVNTIEEVGGGSVRCMMAEIFVS